MEPAELSGVLKRFYAETRKETHTALTLWKPFVPGWTDFYLVPLKESRFQSIEIKHSSQQKKLWTHRWKILRDRDWFPPQNTSVQFPKKTLKLSIERIFLAWILLKVWLTQHDFTPFSILEEEAVNINARWNQVTFSWKQRYPIISPPRKSSRGELPVRMRVK